LSISFGILIPCRRWRRAHPWAGRPTRFSGPFKLILDHHLQSIAYVSSARRNPKKTGTIQCPANCLVAHVDLRHCVDGRPGIARPGCNHTIDFSIRPNQPRAIDQGPVVMERCRAIDVGGFRTSASASLITGDAFPGRATPSEPARFFQPFTRPG
jgi:hypothetical protein